MPLIDDSGRVFGRVNLIDALVLVFVLVLVPLGYGAWRLFRMPAPEVTALEPARVPMGSRQRVYVHGRHLRPYLRAFIGTQKVPLLIESPTRGEFTVPPLDPGSYDLQLYDEAQQLTLRPTALVVTRELQTGELTVRFIVAIPGTLDALRVGEQSVGGADPLGQRDTVTIVGVGAREQVPGLMLLDLSPDTAPERTRATHQIQRNLTAVTTTLRATMHETPAGWKHRDQLLKPGAIFTFETPSYTFRGEILDVRTP